MKKKNVFYILIACVLCLIFALTGCNNPGNNPDGGNDEDTGTYYTVTFDSRGGSAIESQRVREGGTAHSPQLPIRSGYLFTGWFKSDNSKWNFATDRVNSDITLSAGWQEEESTGTYYSVTFDSRGGSAVESQRVREGNPAVRPQTPEYEGYFFTGWFKQDNSEWNFDTDRVNSDISLYAGWQAEAELPESTASLTFVKEGNSYTVTGVGEETTVIIPAEHEGLPVTKIQGHHGTGAFADKAFTSVTLPDTVTEIGQNTFYGCKQLVEVILGADSALSVIGNNAFSGCSSLKNIAIPQGVTTIGSAAFNNCASVESFNVASGNTVYRSENGHLIETATQTLIHGANNSAIPQSVKILGMRAFQRINDITELNVPKTVTKIGDSFINASTVTKINYAGTQAEWEQIEKGSMWNYGNRNVQVVYSGTTTPSQPVNLSAVYLTFGNETVTAQLYDNTTSRDLISRLPLTLSFSDFNNTEKIAYLPSGSAALDTSDAPQTFTPAAGDLAVYIPWGNISLFYKAFRASSGLAPFGKIDGDGIAKLSQISDNTQVTISREKPATPEPPTDSPKVLVAYFSATNTTKGVAEAIHSQVIGSDIYSITPAVPYTSADLNYNNSSCRANREQNDPTARPEISGQVENIKQYDVIFIGYPIWWGQAPKIIYTFFESYDYDFSGVTIIPFCTSGSSGIGSSATNLHSLAPSATWKTGARISGNNVSSLIAQMN